jgi:hypothetical protein
MSLGAHWCWTFGFFSSEIRDGDFTGMHYPSPNQLKIELSMYVGLVWKSTSSSHILPFRGLLEAGQSSRVGSSKEIIRH